MSCNIEFNKDGKIARVNTIDGKESKLFRQISQIPHIKTLEEALDSYKNIFSSKLFYNIIGEKGAGRLEKYNSSLQQAKELEKNKIDYDSISNLTGWYKQNNQWKYLAPELIAEYSIKSYGVNNIKKLKDVLQKDSTILEIYPEMGDVQIVFYDNSLQNSPEETKNWEQVLGAFSQEKNLIGVNVKNRNANRTLEEISRTLAHETTHYIQRVEGLPLGGGFYSILFEAQDILGIDYNISYGKQYEQIKNADLTNLTNNEINIVTEALKAIDAILKQDSFTLSKQYNQILGEVDANIVEDVFSKINKGLDITIPYNQYLSIFAGERGIDLNNMFLLRNGDIRFSNTIIEPTLTFKSDQGNAFNSFKEALQDSVGGDMEIGIETQKGFKPLHTVSSNMNVSTTGGLINNLIANDILSGEKVIEDGVSYLKAEGFDELKQMVNEAILPRDKFKTHKDGRIEILEEKEQKPSKFYDAIKDFTNRAFGAKTPKLSEEALQSRLLEFLKDINVSVLTLDEYSKKYKTKNGVDPSAEALADIANQVVAFREGRIELNELAEETAHFIVEAWSSEDIEGLINNIHKTQSYLDHSEVYRQIYTKENSNMSEQEIEYLVRKEILGKELAHNLVNSFQTETNPNIVQRLYDLLIKFFDTILLRDNYKSKLDDLTFKVQDLILNKNSQRYLDTSRFKNKKFRLYSVNPQSNLVKALQEQERVLKELGRGSIDQVRELENMLNSAMTKETVNSLNSLAKRQVIYIKEAVRESNRRGNVLSNEENIVYNNLKDSILPSLNLVQASIRKDPNYRYQSNDIEDTVREINDVIGMVQLSKNDVLDKVVEDLITAHDLQRTPEVVEELKKAIQTVEKDTTALYQYFGLVTHAQDPLLNLLGNISGRMYQDATEDAYKRVKDFQNKLRELGFKEGDVSKLLQDDGWIISKWDFNEGEEFDKTVKLKAYLDSINAIIGDLNIRKGKGENIQAELDLHITNKNKSVEELLKNFNYIPEITNTELNDEVHNEAQRLKNLGGEGYLSDEYLKEQEDKYEILKISKDTQKVLKKFSNLRAQVRRSRKVSKNGTPIMTIANKQDMDFINYERKKAMSPYTEEGLLKDGLEISSTAREGSVKINDNEYLNVVGELSKEARIALDMNKLIRDFIDNKYPGASNDKIDLNGRWFEDLLALEADSEVTRQDIIDWFNANTSVGFSKEFFDNAEAGDIFDDYSDDENVSKDIEAYKQLLSQRRSLLSLYRDSNNSTNTNVNAMTEKVKQDVLLLSQEIENKFSVVSAYLKGRGEEVVERRARVGANESYFGYIADHNLNTEEQKLEFSLKHMTAGNRKKVQAFKYAVESGNIPEKMQRIVDEFGTDVLRYAQSRLLPYYASYAPIDLQNFYDELRGDNSISEAVKKLNESPDVRLSVSYDYLDNNESDILNPNRDPNFKGGGWQPSLTKKPTIQIGTYKRTFDFKNKNWDSLERNKKLKQLYDYYIDFQAESQKSNGVEGSNVYLAPQVEATRVQKIRQLFSKENKDTATEFIKNMYLYRVSDMTEGELDENGNALMQSNIKIIPRYFTYRLENKANVSKDLFYSSAMMAQQAELRRNRVKYYSQMSSVMEAIQNQGRYTNIGKRSEATNTYKMARSYADYAFFGIEDTAKFRVNLPLLGQTDMTKAIKFFHRVKQNLALAYTPVAPLTSLFTALPNMAGEWLIGQYVDDDSMRKAGKEMMNKDVWQVDILNPYSTGKSIVMLEHFGILDFADRFKSSGKGKGAKLVEHADYGMHKMADYPIKANVLLSQLYGHRVYQGELYDFNDFKAMMSGKTKSEVRIAWREAKPLYNYISVEKGNVKYSEQLLKDLNLTQEQFKLKETSIISKARAMAQRVDGTIRQEEKTYAQRNYALRYTMTHKGWQALSYSYRFKGKHLNLQTGEIEEGSYRTVANLATRSINTLFKERDLNKFLDTWKNATPAEKINLIRIGVDTAVLGAIYFAGLAFAGWADDDEEDYSKQALAYLFERVTNETVSSQLGLFPELYNTVKEPIVGVSQVSDLVFGWHNIFTGDEKIKSGRYYGLTKRERYLIKNIVGVKPAYDLWNAKNLKSQRDSYNFFSDDNDRFNPMAWIITRKEYLEE